MTEKIHNFHISNLESARKIVENMLEDFNNLDHSAYLRYMQVIEFIKTKYGDEIINNKIDEYLRNRPSAVNFLQLIEDLREKNVDVGNELFELLIIIKHVYPEIIKYHQRIRPLRL